MSSAKRVVLFLVAAIVLGILFLLGINSFLAWQAQSNFDARIAAIRAAGEPGTLLDLAPAPVSPDKNAAAILQQIDGSLAAYGKEAFEFEKTDLGQLWIAAEMNGQLPTSEQLAGIETPLNAHPEILAVIHDAAACDAYTSLSDYKLAAHDFNLQALQHTQTLRALANYASAKMTALAAEGKRDEAVMLGIEMLRLTRQFDNEPALFNYFVAVAVRGLAFEALNRALQTGSISPDTRAKLEAELAKHDTLAPLGHAMTTERAFAISNISEQSSGIGRMLRWPALNWMLGQMDLLDRAVAASQLSADELRPNRNMTADDLKKPAPLQGVAEDPNMGRLIMTAFELEFRRLAQTRALRVLNALGEYRQRTGQDADSIDQLSLPKSATIDPWTGQPLIIKKDR
jgi:hypothetical protein